MVHESLVDLAAKGLVRIAPRHGIYVNDFRLQGSVAILSSLLEYHNGQLDPKMAQSLMDMRIMLETETARCAAKNRSAVDLQHLLEILEQEKALVKAGSPDELTGVDFDFHLQVALSSGNLVYPLIINSFKKIYTNLTHAFFVKTSGTAAVGQVFEFHSCLVQAITFRQPAEAVVIMREMLVHGESHLKQGGA